jgi:two-component system sensor histidine kinase MtrB
MTTPPTPFARLVAGIDNPTLRRIASLPPGRRARAVWSGARRRWRRSLQLRMVVYAVVLSSLIVAIFVTLVVSLTTSQLLKNRQKTAVAQITAGQQSVSDTLSNFSQPEDPNIPRAMTQIMQALNAQANGPGAVPALLIPPPSVAGGVPVWSFKNNPRDAITEPLREAVKGQKIAYQYTKCRPGGAGDTLHPCLVVGVPINISSLSTAPFELYYVYPLDADVTAVNVARNTVLGIGGALVSLVAILTWLLTRLVVRPVRLAARTAQRLSAGLLDQRMEVVGEDDLARLAASFNQMAANLQRQIVRLEAMSRLQRRFTSDVSHELRTPLTTVRMAADLIYSGRDELDPLMSRSAELLNNELDRFEGLLTDLLEISRFDAGFAMLDPEPTDLVPIVERVVDRLASVAERAGVTVVVNVPDAPVIGEIDPRRVERILRNLVGNAVEHGERRPVVVTLGSDDSAVAVTVRDHGIGLKPGEEQLVFNRFWRADPSRARQTGGTGLGLSISIEDARLHGGWLEAWGAPGQGAQFRLVLPARAGGRLVGSPLPLVPEDADLTAGAPPVLARTSAVKLSQAIELYDPDAVSEDELASVIDDVDGPASLEPLDAMAEPDDDDAEFADDEGFADHAGFAGDVDDEADAGATGGGARHG